MAENDPRRTPWGTPDELTWGEVVTTTPAASQPDPFQAERDFLASVDTAYAPAAPTAPPAHRELTPRDSRASAAEPTRASTMPPVLPDLDGPTSPNAGWDAPTELPWQRASGSPVVATSARGAPRADGIWGSLRLALAQPFPRNVAIGVGVVPFVALLAGFVLQTLLAGGDWAHGGLAAGLDAALLAVAAAGGVALRFAIGRRGPSFVKLSCALLLGLVAAGGLSLAFSHQLHYAQGQAAERTGNWAAAVAQYTLYGEAAPNAPDLARSEAAWGEQLMASKQYSTATQHLSNALADDPKDAALGARVRKDLYTVYSTWLTAGGDGMPYGDAATFFAAYRASSACDAACQSAAPDLQAHALYLAGTQLASAGDFAQAATEFDAIQAQLPKSSYVAQAHAAGAQAYLAWGEQLLKNADTCKGVTSGAPQSVVQQYQTLLTAMQTLAKNYGDTAEGKQGADLLAAQQQVTGTLAGFPNNPTPTIHLSTKVDETHLIFSNNYNVAVDAKSGAFTFPKVAPGDYNLHTEQDVGYKVNYHIVHSSSGNLYNFHVGALCPLTLGTINY